MWRYVLNLKKGNNDLKRKVQQKLKKYLGRPYEKMVVADVMQLLIDKRVDKWAYTRAFYSFI